MSVYKQQVKLKNGSTKEAKNYSFRFMVNGKTYSGVCVGCSTKEAAEKFEKKQKEIVKKGAEQKTAKALIENFREELTGGTKIMLADAFDIALKKPSHRKPSEKQIEAKRNVWKDFVAYMIANHADISLISDVQQAHAEEYLAYLAEHGRFQKAVTYNRNGKEITTILKGTVSSRTQIFYHVALNEVFNKLTKDAGLIENPFNFSKVKLESETREAFTPQEIKIIFEKADDFVYPLFRIAFATALREGDICTLRWDDVDLINQTITKTMNKTGKQVIIPVPSLMDDLNKWKKQAGKSEYVLPYHAAMYQKNRCGVSYRIKDFLEGIGIKTTKKIDGRYHLQSVKDLHSCRHTFCYNAGKIGIPISVVQSIVGHMTPAMTRMYSAHATMQDKFDAMHKMIENDNDDRMRLLALVKTLPISDVQKILKDYGK